MFPLRFNRVKRLKRRYHLRAIILTGVVCAVGIGWTPARSQETEATEEAAVETVEVPAAVEDIDPEVVITTENIDIPVDQLKLLVQPLTLAELEQEAAAWLLILQAKVKEISSAEIAIKQENQIIAKEEESVAKLEAARTALEEAEAAEAEATPGSPEAEESAQRIEEAKENLAEAQDAIEEATELKQELEADEESAVVLERAKEAGDVQKAQEVLDEAKTAREEMTAGSIAYDSQTEKIDTLTAAIKDFEEAEEAREAEIADTPEYEEATQQVQAARTALKEAIKALDPTAVPEEEEKSAEELDELSSSLQNTDLTDGEAKVAGTVGAEEDLEQQGEQLEEAAEQIQQQSEEQAEAKNQLVVAVTQLQEERTGIIDRFNVILDELERKGGDGEFYRKYVQSVSGVELDLSDTEGLGVRLMSWAQSEEGGLRWAQNTGTFLGVFLLTAIIAQILGIAIDQGLKRVGGVSQLFRRFLVMLVQRGGLLVAFLLALTALEVSLGPVLALLGGVSFVLAFALQSNLGNLASGLMIMVYKPFDVGDEIKVNGLWGYINAITLANTQIKGFNAQMYTVPNNTIWGGTIENLTTQDVRRGSIPISVPFEEDLRRIKQLLIEIGESHPLTIKERGCIAAIRKSDDYRINTALKFWTKVGDYWTVYEDLTFMIHDRFREEGISLALPQQDLHLHYATNGNGNGNGNSDVLKPVLETNGESLEEQIAQKQIVPVVMDMDYDPDDDGE